MVAPKRQILVLMDPQYGFCREIVRGIRAFADAHGGWSLRWGNPHVAVLRAMKPDECAGLICFFGSEDTDRVAAREFPVPTVNCSARQARSLLPRVLVDNAAAGRRAAEHLLERGFTNFAFHGIGGHFYSEERGRGFSDAVREAGCTCAVPPAGHLRELAAWLSGLERPVGILAADDRRAQRIIEACLDLGLGVPEEAAVVGVDDDEFLCESAAVPLSSVDTRGWRVGQRAAELLADLVAGKPRPADPILVPPGDVMTRRSTDTVAVDDPDLIVAVKFIRDHACERMRVEDIIENLRISRRTLEKRFKAALGRTLHEEIRRAQLDRARHLLTQTRLDIAEVADRAGFCDRKAFHKVFAEAMGMPPGVYRDRYSCS